MGRLSCPFVFVFVYYLSIFFRNASKEPKAKVWAMIIGTDRNRLGVFGLFFLRIT